MHATLHPLSRPQRVVGVATTLVAIVLLPFVIYRPTQPQTEPEPYVVSFATVEPDTPVILPAIPLEKVDLPLPLATIDLQEFETPVESTALTSLSPNTSPSAPPRPSGNEVLFGTPEGTGRSKGAGSILKPPVRRATPDDSFGVWKPERAGVVTSLNFCVTDRGRARHVQLAVTSGFDDMDTIAIRWLEKQRFRPGTLDGVPVGMCATYDIRWTHLKASPAEARAEAAAHAAVIDGRSHYPRQFVYWPYDRPFPGCDALDLCEKNLP